MNYLNVKDRWDNTIMQFRVWRDGDVSVFTGDDLAENRRGFVIRAEDATRLRKLLPKAKEKPSRLDELLEWINDGSIIWRCMTSERAIQSVKNKILELKGK